MFSSRQGRYENAVVVLGIDFFGEKILGPLAHLVEHHTFNVVVAGSSPARLTKK